MESVWSQCVACDNCDCEPSAMLVCDKNCLTGAGSGRPDSDMMSVLGLAGRPPRGQLSLCGVVITGELRAATKAYRHDYNLLLPQIVSPVALLSSASS